MDPPKSRKLCRMNINLNQLRAFYSVAKNGTFSRATEELFVTEPAVFAQVRTLERCLGLKLPILTFLAICGVVLSRASLQFNLWLH
jgi:hypothetical protein